MEPAEAWKIVVLNRWPLGKLCASCFDVEAEKARVRYTFVNVTAKCRRREIPTSESVELSANGRLCLVLRPRTA